MKDFTSFLQKSDKPLLVVLGPTASGKTALSLQLAQRHNGEIISADSRQLYKGMEISTDSLKPEEQEKIPHHLLGIADPDQTITLAEYRNLATQKINEIHERKKLPILVGGTGLYLSAIIENYDVPRIPADPKLRAKLEAKSQKEGPGALHKELQKLDPLSAERIHPNNIRYVIRAIEIAKKSGRAKSDRKEKSLFGSYLVGIDWPRDQLYERVNQRVDQQIERGLLEEVRALLDRGYDENLPSMSSLGVKEIIPYIKGEATLEECVETLKKNTRNYAKRQLTWFRRYNNVHWLKPSGLEKI